MSIKIIGLDLDGTTLNNKNEITPRTLKAFKAAMDKGIHVVVSTGRCFHSLPTALEHAPGLEYAVTSNGAEIRELQEGECTYRNCINSETILDIYKLLSGFEKSLYMSVEEIKAHAKQYSQTYKQGFGIWVDNFEQMALKTPLKRLLSKYAPMSVEMKNAIMADQTI